MVDSQANAASMMTGDSFAYLNAGRTLWPDTIPDPVLARRFLGRTEANTHQYQPVLKAGAAIVEADIRNGRLDDQVFDELEKVRSQGYSCSDPIVIKTVNDDGFIRGLIPQLQGKRALQQPTQAVHQLRRVSSSVLEFRGSLLARSMAESTNLNLVIAVAGALPLWASQPFADELVQRFRGTRSVDYVGNSLMVGHSIEAASKNNKAQDRRQHRHDHSRRTAILHQVARTCRG